MEKTVSVIVPIYKVEKYLRCCVDSILNQTFTDMEIILVDDGSPDGCGKICDEYAEKDARIKVIHKKNGGLINARKSGAEIAAGRYITFVDSDDWIEPDMYEVMAGLAQAHGADIIVTEYYRDNDGEVTRYHMNEKPGVYQGKKLEDLRSRMLYSGTFFQNGIVPVVWNKWFKREILLPNLMAVDGRITIGEDMACTYPCMLDAASVELYGEKCFYHYRWRPDSMIETFEYREYHIVQVLYRYLEQCFSKKKRPDMQVQLDYHKLYMILMLAQWCAGKRLKTGIHNLKDFLDTQDIMEEFSGLHISKMKLPPVYKGASRAVAKKRSTELFLWLLLIRAVQHIQWLKEQR